MWRRAPCPRRCSASSRGARDRTWSENLSAVDSRPGRRGAEFEVAMFRQDGAYLDGRHVRSSVIARPRRRRMRSGATSPSTASSSIRSRRSPDRLRRRRGGPARGRHPRHRQPGGPLSRRTICGCCARSVLLRDSISRSSRRRGRRSAAGAALIRTVSAERIRDELNRIFTVVQAGKGPRSARPERAAGGGAAGYRGAARRRTAAAVSSRGRRLRAYVRLMLTKIKEPNLDLALGRPFSRCRQEADGEGRSQWPHPLQRARERRSGQ